MRLMRLMFMFIAVVIALGPLGIARGELATVPAGGSVVGKVVMGKNVIANAKVTLRDSSRKTVAETVSDDKGEFTLKDVPPGGYSLSVFSGTGRSGAAGGKPNITVESGKTTDIGEVPISALPG